MGDQLENTFEKGVHQDNELVAQPQGTYRKSVNGRVTSRKDGSFAWESIKGNTLEFEVSVKHYIYYQGHLQEDYTETDFTSVGSIEGKDKVFLFFVKSDGSLLIGYVQKETASAFTVIYYLKYNNWNRKIFGKEIFEFSTTKPITGYSIYENAEIERIYFNNSDVPPLTLNIAPLLVDKHDSIASDYANLKVKIDNDEFPWIEDDKVSNYYMVLSGAYYYQGITVNPGHILTISEQNINLITHSLNDPKIIEFYPLQNTEFDPLLKFPNIEFSGTIDGNLICGNYLFAVSYYTKCNHYTNWSPLSLSIGIGKSFVSAEPTYKYKSVLDWQKYRGGEFGTSSAKGIQLVLKNTETVFHKIRIAAFLIDPTNPVTTGKIIAEKEIGKILFEGDLASPVPTATVDFTIDFTNYAGIDITIAEVMISTARLEKIEDLTSALGYGTVAGIQEESELSIGAKITGSVKTLLREVPGDVVDRLTSETLMANGQLALPNYPLSGLYSLDKDGYVKKVTNSVADNSLGHLLPMQFYQVYDAAITYATNPYFIGDRFQCNTTVYNWSGAGKLKPVFPILKYIDKDNNYVYDWIVLDEQTGLKMTGNGLAEYWGNETYRIGILPISLSGRPMYVRWIADWQTLERQSGYTAADNCYTIESDGILHWTGDATLVRKRTMAHQKSPCETYHALKYMYPLVTVDLTDIIDDISGFYIVRAPRDKKILSEGFVDPVVNGRLMIREEGQSAETGYRFMRAPGFNDGSGAHNGNPGGDFSSWFENNMYVYITPNQLFDSGYVFDPDSALKPIRVQKRNDYWPSHALIESPQNIPSTSEWNYEIFYRKFYNQQALYSNLNGEVSIKEAVPITEGQREVAILNSSKKFCNLAYSEITGHFWDELYIPRGCRGVLLTLSMARNWNSLPNDDFTYEKDLNVLIVQEQKNKTGLYNDSPESLSNTKYMTVGHYQKVTTEFKNAIYKNGKYEVKDIQLIGGDCHVSLFDVTRTLVNGKTVRADGTVNNNQYQRGDSVIVPLQTDFYTPSRNGRITSFDKPSIYGSGICYNSKEDVSVEVQDPEVGHFEEFNYNHSFSNKSGQDLYSGYPVNLSMLNSYLMRIRYGNKKVYGELDDAFRRYPILQFLDVNGLFGKINNIKSNGQYLLYWQDNCVGYIPIQEKVLQTTTPGAYLQLGVGNAFEIYDELGKTYGNKDKLSLMEANEVFTWFDRRNMCIILMDRTMKLNDKSRIPGIDSLLNNMALPVNTNAFPGIDGTVYSYYDYYKKFLYMTFWNGQTPVTFGIDLERGIFNGEFQWYPTLAYSSAKQLKTVTANTVYKHDEVSATLYGNTFESYIDIVVTGGFDTFLKFVNMICMGNENFFTKIKFSANFQYDTGLYLNEVEEDVNTRNYKRFLDDMRFSIPQGTKGRMEGKVMVVRFTNETPANIVKLLRTSTKIIKLT